jgi:hypothetical protein
MSEGATDYVQVCAAMAEAMDPDLRLAGAELEQMAATIARRMSHDSEDVRASILKLDRVITVTYAQAGKPYGIGLEARWRWFCEQVNA